MVSWLRGTTWFQRIALAGRAPRAPDFASAFRSRILWRVRNRLLLTFFLFGVVPLYLIYGLLYISGLLILGQFASERVRHDLEYRIETMYAIARNLALTHGGQAELLDGARGREPGLAAVVNTNGKTLSNREDATISVRRHVKGTPRHSLIFLWMRRGSRD